MTVHFLSRARGIAGSLSAWVAITLLAFAFGTGVDDAFAHGTNPNHLAFTLGPGHSGTVTSTPYNSDAADTCTSDNGIDYCHHHSASLGATADWSTDIGGTGNVYLSAFGYPGVTEVTNYIYSISPMCDAYASAGYLVVAEVWGRQAGDTWYDIGLVGYTHITPSVTAGNWYTPGTLVGYADSYSYYNPSCYTGAHLHMDAYNYAHYSGWYPSTWFGSVTYSSDIRYLTSIGIIGGAGGTGQNGYGGTCVNGC